LLQSGVLPRRSVDFAGALLKYRDTLEKDTFSGVRRGQSIRRLKSVEGFAVTTVGGRLTDCAVFDAGAFS
jgi:hypothetical protein